MRSGAPAEAARVQMEDAEQAAAAIPARIRLGDLTPDMVRLDAEVRHITHTIGMAACNAETALAAPWTATTPRAGDEACAHP
jgi:hypothetical protein